ncbi:Contains similarity to a putative protein T2J13.100 gi/6522560 from Arabidopsis thaliana BAC T2J13 gb/AL132967 [Arabidopsis thaliana]|nr:Contains similarity to a putative protein T2J13.100 gi/6522560 from Arabidopsis thaliana BAC T2J13 gb/AL132967 [Arabidopsis thaliana]
MAKALNDDDPVYVAVSEDVDQSRLTLLWALKTLRAKKLHLLHVHQLISMTPSSSGLEQSEIDAIQELEQTSRNDTLLKYHDICIDEGVIEQDVDMSCFSANSVGEWIVELIYQNNIKKLIMGATADSHYSEGMVHITPTKADYVIQHAPHCCNIWLVCNGNLIQTREGRFEHAGSAYSSSSSLHSIDSALIPYGGAGRAERVTEPHALSSSEEQSAILICSIVKQARGIEKMYYEEQRRRLEIEELKREKEQRDKMRRVREEALSSSSGVTKILYNEEVMRRREVEAELNRAKAEIEDMKRVQIELKEQHYADCRLLEKERDEAIKTTEELLRALEKGESSIPLQWSVSIEPPQCFICPISKGRKKDRKRRRKERTSMAELMAMGNDVVHVAVKSDVRESRSTLLWALRNLGAKKVCILHVYQPKTASPAARKLEELEAIMYETLHDYFDFCQQEGVNEDDIYISCIEMNDVKQGILELIHESKIKKLVMGAASDHHYSEKMFDLKSRKAKYVYQHAPSSCEVMFMCDGHLIYTKEANLEDCMGETESEAGQSKPKLYSSASPKCSAELVSAIVAYIDTRRDRDMLEPNASEDQSESDRNDQLYRQLKQALMEVEESKREAYEECVRRFKAENTAVEAIRSAREYEAMYNEEAKLRKEGKEALAKQRKMVEKTKQERDDALIIILNGRKLYNEELRRRVEAEEMLGKEKEEHERTKKEIEEVRAIVQDGTVRNRSMQLYNEQLRHRKEMEESMKRQEEELEKTKKEKEEACMISKNLMQLYEDEVRQRKEAEELVKRRREELEKVKKEKEEACSVGQNFMRLYEEEARRRKGTEEELSKVAAEKDAASSVCSEILLLLQSYTRRHGTPSGFSDEDSVTRQPPSYFICPISQEVMREPRVAADGFTYEAESLREWLDNGHETSPMTNLKLAHNNLVPNHALRSAIQEWLQRNS